MAWNETERLSLAPAAIGQAPPAEYEAAYYAQTKRNRRWSQQLRSPSNQGVCLMADAQGSWRFPGVDCLLEPRRAEEIVEFVHQPA